MKKIVSYITRYVLPLALGIGIFWLLYSRFNMQEILAILQTDMNIFWIVVSMIIGLCSHVFRALRWRLQLQALDIHPSLKTLCNAIFGTYAFNLVLPRFGELWRCTYMAGHEKASFTRVFGSAMSDRFADAIAVACITIAVFCSQMGVLRSFIGEYPEAKEKIYHLLTSPWLYVGIVAFILLFVWLLTHKDNNKWIRKIKDTILKMWEGFSSILSMKRGKMMFLFYTIMIWTCYWLQLYLCFFAFDWMSGMGIAQSLVLFVLGSISMVIPVQGGIGPWHAAVIFGLMFYGIGHEEAGAFALIAHGSQMLVVILLGIYTTIAIMAERRQNKPMKNTDCSTQ